MSGSSGGRERGDGPQLPGGRRLKKLAGTPGTQAGRAYQGAIEAVFSIVIATGIGYWADSRFDTSPRWLIAGAVVGFGAFVLRLARMANLIEDPREPGESRDDDDDEGNDESRTSGTGSRHRPSDPDRPNESD